MTSQSWFHFCLLFLLGRGWESFHKHITGHLNSIFLWLLSMSSALFLVCHCPLIVDLSKTLTYNRMSSQLADWCLFLCCIGVFLWFLPQDLSHHSPPESLFCPSYLYHFFCMCSFLLHLGEPQTYLDGWSVATGRKSPYQ